MLIDILAKDSKVPSCCLICCFKQGAVIRDFIIANGNQLLLKPELLEMWVCSYILSTMTHALIFLRALSFIK